MLVLSTTKLTDALERMLVERFDTLTFKFMADIDQAEPFLAEAEILITYGEDIKEAHIKKAKALKWIMVISAGVDQLPFHVIIERNILVTNARGIHQIPMAEYAIAMLLNHYRQHQVFAEQQVEKVWDSTIATREISGRTLTIVGAGAIGQELARIGQAFRMTTIAVTHSGGKRRYFDHVYQNHQLEQALSNADFVVSLLPSTAETKGYYQYNHFEKMKNDAIFLNMGRGDAVDPTVLIKALDAQQFEHAILDVTPVEPLPKDSPLWEHDKITLTPHVSGKSAHYLPRALEIFTNNLQDYMQGITPSLNKVNLSRGY
ncbi:D-2-hydroxyacid dehydrogenase [Amphibacillus cookii]|uniref:D-2-hydroxyacid dehydrogenase n=1 Tax=Amphibacillus cookii TaxID=767787 RepID=UPI0019569AC0|nr:D-2-hydroxyacid dehydrogenase [Amphibacillus cookii]MBM7542158.1 phosphoglycerate dehydrogenase-like enzyme [Amphibacillus cookii]